MRKTPLFSLLGFIALAVLPVGAGVNALQMPLSPVRNQVAAPDFRLSGLDGKEYRLSQFRGKVVVVNFWATWCPPCIEEMPSLQRASEILGKEGIEVLGIAVGQTEKQVRDFMETNLIEFPLLPDRNSEVMGKWPSHALPTTFVVDPQGRLAFRAVGGRDWADPEILDSIRALRNN